MTLLCRNLFVSLLALSNGAFALPAIKVERAAVGDRTLVLTFDDSIQSPDLSKLQIEGYSIENAVFVEESDTDSTRFSPSFLDLTLPGNGKVLGYSQATGTMLVDLPATLPPVLGHILADTAFGGLFRRVTSIEGAPIVGSMGYRWVLNTEEADLPEAILDCDLTFKTRLDLNQSLEDLSLEQESMGERDDGTQTNGLLGFSLNQAQILFQPTVTGRLRIKNGKVEELQFRVTGGCEVMANIKGWVNGVGNYEWNEELLTKDPILVPLGAGLFLKVQNRPILRFDAKAQTEAYSAQGLFRIHNALNSEISYRDGEWRPLAENKMSLAEKSLPDISGQGSLKMSLKARVEMLLEGVQGPIFSFEPFARFTSNQISQDENGGRENHQGNFGTQIYMDMGTNFRGPKSSRTFLLFSREQSVFAPPKEGLLSIKEADSNRIALYAQTFPKADFFIVQQKLGTGLWETASESGVLPKIKLKDLKPNSQYRFRVIGVNAMGSSLAFPQEGLPITTPALNSPPFIPALALPDSGASLVDTSATLVWTGGDPDLGSKVSYTLILDPHYPPVAIHATGIKDTTFNLSKLEMGKVYFWKIIATDGLEKTESAVRSFSLLPSPKESRTDRAEGNKKGEERSSSIVLIPAGTFYRQDGKGIAVGPLYLDKTEVTQADYQKISGKNPSYRYSDSLPVERVTWDEAMAYCREKGGRLPTEAEWEYAARAGAVDEYYWGSGNPSDYAWYRENSNNHSQKVGQKKPNQWGLYDMAGNVFEWVEDWYGEYPQSEVNHPQGPKTGTAKVIRGASWYSEAGNLSLSSRYSNRPGFRNFKVGFRCAKDISGPEKEVPKTSLLGILR